MGEKIITQVEMIILRETIIKLAPSDIAGIGVFAAKDISKGEIIADGIHEEDYKSLVLWSQVTGFDKDLKESIKSFCIGTPEGFFPPPEGSFDNLSVEWYINHSCAGNIGFNNTGDFTALRDIKKGDELTYDYGLAESNPDFSMICDCGSPNCRRLISGNDWKNQDFRLANVEFMLPNLRHL